MFVPVETYVAHIAVRERLPQVVCVFAFERQWTDVGAVTILGMTIYVWLSGLFVDGKLTTVDVGVCIEQPPERILFVTFVVSVTFWMFWLVEHSVDTVGATGLQGSICGCSVAETLVCPLCIALASPAVAERPNARRLD